MSKYYIYHDPKRCIGCFSCEAHCKIKNALPIGPRLCQIIPVGPKSVNNLPRMANIFMPCFHCESPWCVAACPTGAIQKRAEDGIVSINESLCVGCKSCITACPFEVRALEDGKARLVDACFGCGLCVASCPERTITMVEAED